MPITSFDKPASDPGDWSNARSSGRPYPLLKDEPKNTSAKWACLLVVMTICPNDPAGLSFDALPDFSKRAALCMAGRRPSVRWPNYAKLQELCSRCFFKARWSVYGRSEVNHLVQQAGGWSQRSVW